MHENERHQCASGGDKPDRWRLESTFLIGVLDAKNQDANANDGERKQRPDAGEFADQSDWQNAS
jgi:hypothetical protein